MFMLQNHELSLPGTAFVYVILRFMIFISYSSSFYPIKHLQNVLIQFHCHFPRWFVSNKRHRIYTYIHNLPLRILFDFRCFHDAIK